MVQNSKARRGRPRAYDPDAALTQAMGAFWDAGFAATSLDDLSAATGMNRPSLYGAFGDKRALYLQAIERYRAMARAVMKQAFVHDRPLPGTLRGIYQAALSIYLSGETSARGCFLIGTAVTEAMQDPEVRDALAEGLREIDSAFERLFRSAQKRGDLHAKLDPAMLARLASAVLYFLSVRSRAGEPRAVLEATVEAAVELMCGSARSNASRARL